MSVTANTAKFTRACSGPTMRSRQLSQDVSLEPSAPFEKIPELFRSAYPLLVPSRIEGFNTTILEAAHFGVPAIGSDTVGIRDFIRHGETGLLFKEADAEGLAKAMSELSAQPALRDMLGQNAKVAAKDYFGTKVADSFLAAAGVVVPALQINPGGVPACS